ncbi:hypothetical protein SAMN05216503_2384 [Polaribacter sp. KT25b]|uniref:hypothetical protein n=1 Tax=Polaribacter sp. KT25b TaxID=1855336 RepID=UPI00087BC683|nr:hypothetical protein [Polaribacter sp. KT25b]SDS22780.1 hypothetical protein SAMN05216503_2384 [Polaribacter sp. KT25b]
MKKVILFLVFSLVLSGSLFAQKNIEKKVNTYVETVASKITLSSKEKETLKTLKVAQMQSAFEINKKYEKGTPELKEQRKASNKDFSKALIKAFGKERAQEIKKASKKNKKKKE